MRLFYCTLPQILWNCCRYHAFAVAKNGESDMESESEEKKEMLIIDGNAFYEIDLECVKKKKQCGQIVHPEKKNGRTISR